MTTTATETRTLSTAALSQAYHTGFSSSEERVKHIRVAATVRQVVEAFSRAVGRGTVARETYRAWAAGWRAAEAMNPCA